MPNENVVQCDLNLFRYNTGLDSSFSKINFNLPFTSLKLQP